MVYDKESHGCSTVKPLNIILFDDDDSYIIILKSNYLLLIFKYNCLIKSCMLVLQRIYKKRKRKKNDININTNTIDTVSYIVWLPKRLEQIVRRQTTRYLLQVLKITRQNWANTYIKLQQQRSKSHISRKTDKEKKTRILGIALYHTWNWKSGTIHRYQSQQHEVQEHLVSWFVEVKKEKFTDYRSWV